MTTGSLPPRVCNSILKPCINNGRVSTLEQQINGQRNDYFVIAAHKVDSTQSNQCSSVIFLQLDTTDDQYAVAFERKPGWSSPASEATHLEIAESVLEALAAHQASILNSRENPVGEELEHLYDELFLSRYIHEADRDKLDSVSRRLLKDLNTTTKDGLVVDSVGCPLNADPSHRGCSLRLPPVYDALIYLFSLSDEGFRQNHYVPLIQTYFRALKSRLVPRLSDQITKEYQEITVRALLPVVKAQLVAHNPTWEDLASNFRMYLKYPLINQEDVYDILGNAFHGERYDFAEYRVRYLDQKNGNLGEYMFLDVSAEVNGQKRELDLFVKVLMPPVEILQKIINDGIADKEDFFYNTFLALLEANDLLQHADFTARCYLTRVNWMMVLSNMSKRGFEPVSLNAVLDYDGVRSAVVELARFSALSLVLEEILSRQQQRTVRLGDLYPVLTKEVVYINDDSNYFLDHLKSVKTSMLHLVRLFPDLELGVTDEQISKYLDETFVHIFEAIHRSDKFKNAIVHGDLHLGNMLFHRAANGLIDQCALVDFQCLRYMPPAYELVFFLYISCSRTTRLQHYRQLVDEYYQVISRIIRSCGFEPEKLFPEQSFYESLEYMKPAAFYVNVCYNVISKVSNEVREDLFRSDEEFNKYFLSSKTDFINMVWSDESYQRAMADNVRDLVELMSENGDR